MNEFLDLKLLASFLVLAEELNFTRAAKRLHMTQPPLSLQIKQLETRLSTPLFERTNRYVRLTPAGETLRTEAEKLLAMNKLAQQLVMQVGRGEGGGHLSIGFTAVASIYFVPEVLKRFKQQTSGVIFSLQDMGSDAQQSALLRNELDVGFVRPPVVDSRLEAFCVQREPHVLAIPSDHRLASAPSLQVYDLQGEELVTYERQAGRYVYELTMRWLSNNNVLPSRHHDVGHHNSLISVVSAGLGVALVPRSVSLRPISGIVFREFTHGPVPPDIELWITFRKRPSNPLAARIIEIAAQLGAEP